MHWEIYDLLGYGGLTPEVVEYLMSLVTESDEIPLVKLFQRLDDFYQRWCDGEFIDAYTETLPQKKSRQLHEQGIELGQRQVDIYAGLNAMILLLELNRYARGRDDLWKIAFYPSGQSEDRYTLQMYRIISYCKAVQAEIFHKLIKRYLTDVDLSHVYLRRIDLSFANLSYASLNQAYLNGIDLSNADLSRADLSSAYLGDAYLSGAYLRGADFSNAYLNGVDFSHANLSDDIYGDICWDENTKWEGVQGLETAINVPEALKKQLGLSE